MMVSGLKIKCQEMELTTIQMGLLLKDSGKIISTMVKESTLFLTVLSIKENGKSI
jgi:hypothetical protein